MYSSGAIREATYLKKKNGDLIPFRMFIGGSDCSQIRKMLNHTY
jgi:hypothetical protein